MIKSCFEKEKLKLAFNAGLCKHWGTNMFSELSQSYKTNFFYFGKRLTAFIKSLINFAIWLI